MKPTDLFTDFQNRVSEALRNSPAADIEKNVRAMMAQGFSKLDLVTREEFDVQSRCWPVRAPGWKSWKPAWPSSKRS